MKRILLFSLLSSLVFVSCTSEKVTPLPSGCATTIFYSTDVKPFIETKCVICHVAGGGGVGPYDFTLVSELQAHAAAIRNRACVIRDMPQAGSTPLTQDEVDKLRCWIDQGAMDN